MSTDDLTLPPETGRRYLYRNEGELTLRTCTIDDQETDYDGESIWFGYDEEEDDGWYFGDDGRAMDGDDVCARLIKDAPKTEFEKLRDGHSAMMARLKELGA